MWWLIKAKHNSDSESTSYAYFDSNDGLHSDSNERVKNIDGWTVYPSDMEDSANNQPSIILQNNWFSVQNDHFGHYKYFIYKDKDVVLISNRVEKILENIDVEININAVVLYALGYHYLAGQTLFKGVGLSKHGTILTYSKDGLKVDSYWDAGKLLLKRNDATEIQDVATSLEKVVGKELNRLNVSKISHSITGGIDSRILLSILLKLGVDIHGYTYGDENSVDVVIAKQITKESKIPYKDFNIKFDADSFGREADKSVYLGNRFVSITSSHEKMM